MKQIFRTPVFSGDRAAALELHLSRISKVLEYGRARRFTTGGLNQTIESVNGFAMGFGMKMNVRMSLELRLDESNDEFYSVVETEFEEG